MNVPGTTKLNAGACGSVTSAENTSFKYAIAPLLELLSRVERAIVMRAWAKAGTVESAFVENVAATVVSAGTVALAGNAALADAPPGSDGSGTGTVTAPGAGLGIGTASLAEKLCGEELPGGVVAPGGSGPPGALAPPPPPPPQAAKRATPRTAPPMSAEIRFMPV